MANKKFVRIMMQSQTHLDTLCALRLLVNTPEGERRYPGVKDAEFVFWEHGTVSPDGKTWRDFVEEGCLPIGVLGGPLDEHPSPDFPDRKAQNESTTSLVAKELGLDKGLNYKLYAPLIKLVTQSDLQGAGDDRALHLASVIKQIWRNGGDAISFAFAAIDAIVSAQQRFLDALYEVDHLKNGVKRITDNGMVVIGIESDNDQIGPAARYRGVAVVSQLRTTGHVLVLTNSKLVQAGTVAEIARDIRSEELIARGFKKDAKDYRKFLADPGQITLVPNWCYQVPGNNMLNGTETAPGVEPTAIDPLKILDIICNHAEKQVPERIDTRPCPC